MVFIIELVIRFNFTESKVMLRSPKTIIHLLVIVVRFFTILGMDDLRGTRSDSAQRQRCSTWR